VFHKFIGPEYVKSLLSPGIGAQTRLIISQFDAQQVYISRQEIENQIKAAAKKNLGEHLNTLFQPTASEQSDVQRYERELPRAIQILDTLVLTIELPTSIVAAINRQTEQF